MDLNTLEKNLRSIDIWAMLKPILQRHIGLFEQANRDQLWDGKTALNQDIHPNYLEDPYFDSPAKAMAYANWKSSGGYANPKRKKETPNMYIDGSLVYNTIKATLLDSGISIEATAASSFDGKYANIYGVTDENLKKIILGVVYDEFMVVFKNAISKQN